MRISIKQLPIIIHIVSQKKCPLVKREPFSMRDIFSGTPVTYVELVISLFMLYMLSSPSMSFKFLFRFNGG